MCKTALGLLAGVAFAALAGAAAAKPPSWDTIIESPSRFKVLTKFNSEAVLDKETGLVWDRSPSTAGGTTWANALAHCYNRVIPNSNVNGRRGWRLPTVTELGTLWLNSGTYTKPSLPPGHPFQGIQFDFDDEYWTSTVYPFYSTYAYVVGFGGNGGTDVDSKNDPHHIWCVRSGNVLDGGGVVP